MRLKSFYAKTRTEAMQMVRDTLGEDAIIVATREEKAGKAVHVTAAIDPGAPAFELNRTGAAAPSDWLQYDAEEDENAIAEELTGSGVTVTALCPGPTKTNFGRVAKTPKPSWSGADIVGTLQTGLGCEVALDTDVNGSGLAEATLGAGRGLDVVTYVTVGTGVGGGVIINGRPLHGLNHPEMGHILLKKRPADADFGGVCPFHGHCVEGLTSGPAILARLGHPLSDADPAAPIFDLIAGYLGEFCATLSLIVAPQRIILGGGVMSNAGLYPRIRAAYSATLADYLQSPAVHDVDSYIVPPALGDSAGVIGAMMLASIAS